MSNSDRSAIIYDSSRSLPEASVDAIVKSVSKHLNDCQVASEACVKTGRFAIPLIENAFDVVGLGISEKAAANCKTKESYSFDQR